MKYNLSYERNGVPQTIFLEADNSAVAQKYFLEQMPDAKIYCIDKTTRDDERPGKPVMTVPRDYEHGLLNVFEDSKALDTAIIEAKQRGSDEESTSKDKVRGVAL